MDQIASGAGLPLRRWNIMECQGRAEAERRKIRTVPTLALISGERVPFRIMGHKITPENVQHLLSRFPPGETVIEAAPDHVPSV